MRRPPLSPSPVPMSVAALIALIQLGGLAAPVRAAETADPLARAEAAKLIEVVSDPAFFELSMARQRKLIVERMAKENKGREEAIGRLFDDTVAPLFRARFQALKARRAAAMASRMTASTLAANTAFWSSPDGQALLAVTRDESFDKDMYDGMRDRLGIFDGLALKNRLDDFAEAMRDATRALDATRSADAKQGSN